MSRDKTYLGNFSVLVWVNPDGTIGHNIKTDFLTDDWEEGSKGLEEAIKMLQLELLNGQTKCPHGPRSLG